MWLRVPDDTPLKPTSAIGYPLDIQLKYDGMWQVYTLIRANRTALENGMRGKLRFKRGSGPWFVAIDDKGHVIRTYLQANVISAEFPENCADLAQSLGVEAEFIERDDDGSK
jgi:hypothetical protein